MRYGSVCSGIEAATMAWHALGWEPAFFSEIEAFPRAVLEHRYPDVPLHGDFTTIEENQYGKIDLLVGGTPCQSFSVAGLRGGLDDERGNLALEFCRLAQRERPRWIVWENVPGVLSSNGGRDFGSILGALAELGYGLAYRVLDAQYFGVAQRRRRVFVVGYLGDWRRAAAVLFERHSMSGHPAPSREKRQVAPTIPSRSTAGGGLGTDFDLDGGLIAGTGGHPRPAVGGSSRSYVAYDILGTPATQEAKPTDVHVPLRARAPGQSEASTTTIIVHGTQDPCVSKGPAFALGRNSGGENVVLLSGDHPGRFNNIHGGSGEHHSVLPTLEATNPKQIVASFQPTADCLTAAYGTKWNGNASATNGSLFAEVKSPQTGVFYGGQGAKAGSIAYSNEVSPTLKSSDSGTNRSPSAHIGSAVRRLTPVECERLQGFPDGFTAIPWKKKGPEQCPDGPRYKALGNSMAVPVMRWIGERIQLVDDLMSVL